MEKVYLSGKITGLPEYEYLAHFRRCELFLTGLGYSVINPARVSSMLPKDTTYEQYMDMSFCMLNMADAIYMLSNFLDSKGALIELQKAKEKGLKILYESEVAQ